MAKTHQTAVAHKILKKKHRAAHKVLVKTIGPRINQIPETHIFTIKKASNKCVENPSEKSAPDWRPSDRESDTRCKTRLKMQFLAFKTENQI